MNERLISLLYGFSVYTGLHGLYYIIKLSNSAYTVDDLEVLWLLITIISLGLCLSGLYTVWTA